MLTSIITTYLISQLHCECVQFGRLDWIWNDGTGASIDMNIDKQNNIAGILIMNFGISTTGAGGNIVVSDVNQGSRIVYTTNNDVKQTLLSPFLYLSLGPRLRFTSTVNCVYGLNFITVQKVK